METIGSYRLGKTIGKGSYGKVRLGFHKETGHQVAVKIVQYHNAKSKRQLEREIAIISKFQHPNIVKLLEVLRHDDSIYLILEYVGGGELFDYIMGRGRISEKMGRKFFRQMVSAVGYCHKNGVCHRDIKPENLILDEEGNIKINDFGLSNFFTPGTLLNSFCGSPVYAAPEIMAEKCYDGPAADIWSLGIVLYAMVVGQLPWKLDERGIIRDVNDLIRAKFVVPPSAAISKGCEDLIRKMVVADPDQRLSLEEIARHPWVVKDFGRPIDFEGEVPKPMSPRTSDFLPHLRIGRSNSVEQVESVDGLLTTEEVDEVQKVRRGSAPENFIAKLLHKVTSPKASHDRQNYFNKEQQQQSEKQKQEIPKGPTLRAVRGTFLLDVTTQQAPKHILAEVSHALRQSKVEFTQEDFVFHCEGKVNVKSDPNDPGVTPHKIKFDIEICSIAGLQGLFGLYFKRGNGSTWLFRSLTVHLIDRMKL